MKRVGVLWFLVGLCFLPGETFGQQAQLVVVDATGSTIGDLIQLRESGGSHDLMMYRYGASDYVVLRISVAGTDSGGGTVLFDNGACIGQAWITANSDTLLVPNPFGLVRNGTLYRVEPNSDTSPAGVGYILYDSGDCIPWNPPPGFEAILATTVGAMPAWTSPLKYELNPLVFWDQFQTGDLTRWSN